MTILENSYCRPETVDEWGHFEKLSDDDTIVIKWGDKIVTTRSENIGVSFKKRTEIPVSHFLDLLNDRIVPWRLGEHGFQNPLGNTYTMILMHHWGGMIVTRLVRVVGGRVSVNGDDVNLTNFTDLLTLIRMLTPPTESS